MRTSTTYKLIQHLSIVVAFLFISLGSSCQMSFKSDVDSMIIPLDISSQRPVLELMINGKGPYLFIFDTGSTSNVIDENLAKEFELAVLEEVPLRTPGSENTLMSNKVKVSNVTFKSLDLSKDAMMYTMAIREILPVDGILSPVFFKDYLMVLDYPNSKLILSNNELILTDTGVIPFLAGESVINFNITVGDLTLPAHLDSGNPGGINIPFSQKDNLKFKEEPVEAGVISTPVASFRTWKAILNEEIKIGNVVYINPDVLLIEGFPFVNLGYQVLKDLRITMDTKNNLIKFDKPTSIKSIEPNEEIAGETNDYTGWYGGHERKVFIEKEHLFLQRGGAPKLELIIVEEDVYKMVFNMPVRNELPNVRFERDGTNKVNGLTFLFEDGREEFVKKD